MRFATILVFTLLVLHVAAVADDPLTPLYEAEYIDAHDVEAHLPHGDITIHSGILGLFPGLERRLAGILMGDVTLVLDALPSGPGVLDLFTETFGGKDGFTIKVSKGYLLASYGSGTFVEPSGYATRVRSWDELERSEQDEFISIYLQCYSDGFVEEQAGGGGHWAGGGGGGTAPTVNLRDPVGHEVYAVVWNEKGERHDYRVNADGSKVTIKDYYRGITMYESPWAPEEGDLDENVDLQFLEIHYTLEPKEEGSEKGDFVSIAASALFTVREDAPGFSLISAPWLDWTNARFTKFTNLAFDDYIETAVVRGGEGISDWMLFINEQLSAGITYRVSLSGKFEIPRSYAATGYGGVYRFDTEPIWPGEDNPIEIVITVDLPGKGWNTLVSSKGFIIGEGDMAESTTTISAAWKDNTRNQMIAATQFPKRELETEWGTLDVYAPSELIDSVHETEYVTAVGDMMEYFTGLWGDWQGEGANTNRQPIFLLPDESGVQAFENAGFVFILGGSRTGIPLVAHEVAHLWWGQGFSAPRWFQEGMANYAAAKFYEHYMTKYNKPDPLMYRRYIMNFSLGHELPISLERRDELDDSAAIYHNSAGFLMTADERIPGGLDAILHDFYTNYLNEPNFSHAALRELFAAASPELGKLWDRYVEDGVIDTAEAEDDTYRELVHTPGRDTYTTMLHWLTPAYMKSAVGDFPGAIYCAQRALEYRSEPKDYYFIADLHFKAGLLDEAIERATVLMENPEIDDATMVKTTFLFAKIFKAQGDSVNERASLEAVVADGPASNLMYQVQQAQERLDELTGDSE